MNDYKLEVCCADILSAEAAFAGGADRVELCTGLAEGGMTPSQGFIRQVVEKKGQTKVHVLIRPRAGDFTYSESEVRAMISDISFCKEIGVDGVVIGVLNPDSTIDTATTERLIQAADGMAVTFDRAFDVCQNPEEAFRIVTSIGCNHLLSSGGAPKAIDALDELSRLVGNAPEGFNVIAASGVNPDNALRILESTGVHELHASASALQQSSLKYYLTDQPTREYDFRTTSIETVRRLVDIIHNYNRNK